MFDRFDDIYGCYNEPTPANAETDVKSNDDKYNLKIFDPKDKAALVIQVPPLSARTAAEQLRIPVI